MSHGVLAVGVVVLFASGNVWYLPAYIDLRAGQDRPRSRRLAAAAVLTGWVSAALTVFLLLIPVDPGMAALLAVAGTTAVVSLTVQAWLRRSEEQREEEARWSVLFPARTADPVGTTEDEQ
ncbi:hypothetical protein OG936_01640 [Streptomyces sp. NBC_00846]|uniref:hypothetical protein n=1 Tax=Streptomyces sp. NBC_00846 TaxID=2975849 RepID=UPI0038647F22|nr:hypothetical protein OG936_01640 [Streptomyces sp. NBC_00846]